MPKKNGARDSKARQAFGPCIRAVKVRLGEGSSILRRRDLQTEKIPAEPWTTSSDPAMLKAPKPVCNTDDFEQAMRASYQNGRFDLAAFNSKLKPMGITQSVTVIAESTAAEQLELHRRR